MPSSATVVGAMLRPVGLLLWISMGLVMTYFWFITLADWLGPIGFVVGVVLVPGAVIFPGIYWLVEGVFPAIYFICWGIGLAGMMIYGLGLSMTES